MKPCINCGLVRTHGDRFGCCGNCKTGFSGLEAFDRHFHRQEDGTPVCRRPLDVHRRDGTPLYEEVPIEGGSYFRLATDSANPWGQW